MNEWILYGSVVALVLLLRLFVLSIVRVKGNSMLSTLHNGDWLLVLRLPYLLHPPRRQDVVICRYPGRTWRKLPFLPMAFVKRIMALPGETIEVVEGQVQIDGLPLPEPYLDPARTRFFRTRPPKSIPDGHYYVLGDNRDNSNDSRSVGPLARQAIRGRAVCILWPPQRAGRVG